MKIVIIENDWMFKDMPRELFEQMSHLLEHGWGNGYALIPRNHPLHGVSYDRIHVNAHGGLTYNTMVDRRVMNFYNLSKRHLGKWMVGFDTMHYSDNPRTITREYVINETRNLAKQLKEYGRAKTA